MKIKFEDKNIMILDKASGLVVTDEGRKKGDSIESLLRQKYAWAKKIDRSGIVHRLDKGTSGLLIVAKSEKYLTNLKSQFKERKVYKEYVALVCGDVSFRGEILAPLVKKNHGVFGRRQVGIGGKKAWTTFKLIGKYRYLGKIYSLVSIELKTGRTHQIRAHFKYLGWPLVGDKLYGGDSLLLKRPFLHAQKLEFMYPEGKKFKIETGLANDLENVLKKLSE